MDEEGYGRKSGRGRSKEEKGGGGREKRREEEEEVEARGRRRRDFRKPLCVSSKWSVKI